MDKNNKPENLMLFIVFNYCILKAFFKEQNELQLMILKGVTKFGSLENTENFVTFA